MLFRGEETLIASYATSPAPVGSSVPKTVKSARWRVASEQRWWLPMFPNSFVASCKPCKKGLNHGGTET